MHSVIHAGNGVASKLRKLLIHPLIWPPGLTHLCRWLPCGSISRAEHLSFQVRIFGTYQLSIFPCPPRVWTATLWFTVKKQTPILNTGRSPATLARFGLPSRRRTLIVLAARHLEKGESR
jgi:hypothetical protein